MIKVSCGLSVVCCGLSVVGCQLSVVSPQLSDLNTWFSNFIGNYKKRALIGPFMYDLEINS